MSRLRRPMRGAFILFACLLPLVVSCDDGKKKVEPAGVPDAARSGVTVAAARYEVTQERFASEVTVVIRDRDDAPLSGVVVSLLLEEGPEDAAALPAEATTDDEGVAVFTVTGNTPGSASFRVRAVSPVASVDPVTLQQAADVAFFVTLEAAPDGEPTYVWDSGNHPFRLTLLDPAGPVAGARLAAPAALADLAVTPEVATTDASGQAAFVMESTRTGATPLEFGLAGIVGAIPVTVALVPFGHGSLRPACQFAPDPSRTAYFPAPVVVASDWGEPMQVAAPLADACPNDAIELSPDGTRLYFFWSPVVNGDAAQSLHEHTGTYVAERVGEDPGVFSTPRYFKLSKGVEGASVDGALSFTADGGAVVFHSTRAANLGFQAEPPTDDFLDVYRAQILDGEPGVAVNLGAPINSTWLDGEHGLAPDGTLYVSSNRPGGQGGVDLWACPPDGDGWAAPVNPGAPLNSDQWDGQPGFSAADPDTMYFVSNRDGPSAIYRSTWTGTAWGVPELVITGYVGEPSFTATGDILYFVHVLVDADGVFGSNIWYVRRR